MGSEPPGVHLGQHSRHQETADLGASPVTHVSSSPGARTESRLGGPSGMGPGHSSLAVGPTGPVKAVPPAAPHRGPSQHRLTPRGQDSQRLHPKFSGLRSSGEWEPLSYKSKTVAELKSSRFTCPDGGGWTVPGRAGPGRGPRGADCQESYVTQTVSWDLA